MLSDNYMKKNLNNNNCLPKSICWLITCFWGFFLRLFWWNMVLWSKALKSTLPVTFQQDFSKEAAGSLKSNMTYGEAQLCIISCNVSYNTSLLNIYTLLKSNSMVKFGHHNFCHKIKFCALLQFIYINETCLWYSL